MEKNHIFSEVASGAQSTQAQEPVKAVENINNPYGVEEVDLEQFIAHPDEEVPAIYVGSYGAYASGSLRGAWVSIEACADYEEFMMVCRWIHRFEQDPEYMFQDYMGFPGQFYREGSFTEQDFDNVREFAELDEDEQEAFEAFLDCKYGSYTDGDNLFYEFRDAYCGKFDSEEDYAEQLAEDCGYYAEMPSYLRNYFDIKAFARDIFLDGFTFWNGYVFRD